ncbi:MAG: penicillin-binding protein 2 [bacterium]
MKQNKVTVHIFYKSLSIVIFLVLIFRFVQLQLYNWDKYFHESEKNRIREVVIEAARGIIYDRHGEILVDNRPAYTLSVVPYEFLKTDSTISLLSEILEQPHEALKARTIKEKIGNFTPVKIKRQISFKVLSDIEEHRLDLPGVFYSLETKRFYPAGVRAPHIFGYLGEVTSEELTRLKEHDYRLGDLIGKSGIELQYENYLRGEYGLKYVEVDVLGREVRDLPELSGGRPRQPGKNLYLTFDAEIQRYLENALADKKGAAAVLDARNGEILALVSKPDYDPELFSNPLTTKIWDELINNEGNPLYNRSCQSLYPPGSTYKLVLVAAGLESGLMNLQQKIFCTGTYRLGRRNFDCWKKGGHGWVGLIEAIEQSCNVYFYTKGLEVGLDKWSEFSRRFHFGKKTEIDLPNESAGLVPDRRYFDTKYGEKGWTRGLLLNLSVGQGDLLTTPLQMAYFAMTLGNEGVAYQPHLLKKVVDPISNDAIIPEFGSTRIEQISPATFKVIKEGMYRVVNGIKGTAKSARRTDVKVCGKTGTAQNPHGESHAWFIGFAPMEKPEIAFCVLVENGGSGGAVAAPIARGFLSLYFDNKHVASN